MPVIGSDLVAYPPLLIPQNDTDPSGGDINTGGGPLSQVDSGVLIPTSAAPTSGTPLPWRYKAFRKNTHGTDSFYAVKAWILNGLKGTHGQGTAQIVSDNAAEVGNVVLFGFLSGVHRNDSLVVNGITPVGGAVNFDANSVVRAQLVSDAGALIPALGNISITVNGTLQGIIPMGYNCATWEFEFGFDVAQNSNLSATNRLSNPVGVSFGRPLTLETAVTMPGTNLAAGGYIGYWFRFNRVVNLYTPTSYDFPIINFNVQDAA